MREDPVPGYTTTYPGNDIVNIYSPGKTAVPVIKWWDDGNDYDRIRPGSVTVRLYANGRDTGRFLVLSRANNWRGVFDNLDEYANGKRIVYTVAEDDVLYYKVRISGDQIQGFSIVNYHRVDKPNGNWPRTGDDSNVAAWMIPFTLSGAALVAGSVFYHKKKKKESEEEK